VSDDELQQLRRQIRDDRALMKRAAEALAQIDRGQPFDDTHADVLAALRIRVEGKERASLEELLTVAQDLKGGHDLGAVLADVEEKPGSDWPVIEEKKRDWPGL
jgi:hypothetical protein